MSALLCCLHFTKLDRSKVAFSSSNSIGQVMRAANFSCSGVVVLFVKGQEIEAVHGLLTAMGMEVS
jgi:hypothetical protein